MFSSSESHALEDFGWGIFFYVMANVIRFAMIFAMFPVLRMTGYGMTWRKAVVMAWGGLRGAVGLALALFVLLDEDITDTKFKQVVMLHMVRAGRAQTPVELLSVRNICRPGVRCIWVKSMLGGLEGIMATMKLLINGSLDSTGHDGDDDASNQRLPDPEAPPDAGHGVHCACQAALLGQCHAATGRDARHAAPVPQVACHRRIGHSQGLPHALN